MHNAGSLPSTRKVDSPLIVDSLYQSVDCPFCRVFRTVYCYPKLLATLRMNQPDPILLILTDQQTASAMSGAGNPHLSTPALDMLAARGTRFTQATCSNPICIPSRASLFSGLMSHRTGVMMNINPCQHRMRGECVVRRLKEAGYRTGYIGKWHVPQEIEDSRWSGFEYLEYCHRNDADAQIPDACRLFLEHGDDHPFFLVASFVNPHDICEVARQLAGSEDRLPNGVLPPAPEPEHCPPLPVNAAPPRDEPSVIRIHQRYPELAGVYPVAAWTEGTWRQYLWYYYRLVERVDAHIGRVLNALRDSGQQDNTLVIFTSDHGDGAAAHGWNQKTLFYEEVVRVPLIAAMGTGCARVNDSRLVNTGIDLAATWLDAAGLRQPPDLSGSSFLPQILGKAGPEPAFAVAQTHLHREFGVRGDSDGRMLRDHHHKYMVFTHSDPAEALFDLKTDPGELINLATHHDHQEKLAAYREKLRAWMEAEDDPFRHHMPVSAH